MSTRNVWGSNVNADAAARERRDDRGSLADLMSARYVMAPMAGITDAPFRMLIRRYGCRFAFTEMVDVNGLIYGNRKTGDLIKKVQGEGPLGAQLVGRDPEKLVEAARMLQEEGFDLIDLNCGCPARKVVGAGKGAALLREPLLLAELLRELRKAVKVDLTVKTRSGWDKHIHRELIHIFNSEGVDAVCMHARTRQQGFKGRSDAGIVRETKELADMPVFASGDIFTPRAALDIVRASGADGAFLARGALGQPWIFAHIERLSGGEEIEDVGFEFRKEVIREHFLLSERYCGIERAFKRMHKHVGWYLKPYKGLHEILGSYRKNRDMEEFEDWLSRLAVGPCGRKLHLKERSS